MKYSLFRLCKHSFLMTFITEYGCSTNENRGLDQRT